MKNFIIFASVFFLFIKKQKIFSDRKSGQKRKREREREKESRIETLNLDERE